MTMYPHRHAIRKMGTDLQEHNKSRGTTLTSQQFAKSKHARSSFASLTVEMAWLLPKFETYAPSFWFAGVGLLVLRLVQTSLMALVRTQRVQAAVVSLVTLVSVSLLRELSPMRLASDNRVVVLSQALIFLWVRLTHGIVSPANYAVPSLYISTPLQLPSRRCSSCYYVSAGSSRSHWLPQSQVRCSASPRSAFL